MMWRCVVAGVCAVAVSVVVSAQVSATESQLQQVIEPLDCTITETSVGTGTIRNSDCPPQPPVIIEVIENGGRPIITGRYDAIYSLQFRVRFAGKWYVLGVDSQLTTINNRWRLDLSQLEPPLEEGNYQIIAQMRATNGQVLSDSEQLLVDEPSVPGNPGGGNTPPVGPVIPGAPDTGFLRAATRDIPALIAILLSVNLVAGILLFIAMAYRARRRRDSQVY